MGNSTKSIIYKLSKYFEKREDVLFSFLFDSYAKSQDREGSDIDIAIYFKSDSVEFENGKEYIEEKNIWKEIIDITKNEIDLIILNRAPAYISDDAVRNGIPIIIKDYNLFIEYFLCITEEAEYFRQTLNDMWRLKYGIQK